MLGGARPSPGCADILVVCRQSPEPVSAAPLAIESFLELDLRDPPGRVQVDRLTPRAALEAEASRYRVSPRGPRQGHPGGADRAGSRNPSPLTPRPTLVESGTGSELSNSQKKPFSDNAPVLESLSSKTIHNARTDRCARRQRWRYALSSGEKRIDAGLLATAGRSNVLTRSRNETVKSLKESMCRQFDLCLKTLRSIAPRASPCWRQRVGDISRSRMLAAARRNARPAAFGFWRARKPVLPKARSNAS